MKTQITDYRELEEKYTTVLRNCPCECCGESKGDTDFLRGHHCITTGQYYITRTCKSCTDLIKNNPKEYNFKCSLGLLKNVSVPNLSVSGNQINIMIEDMIKK
jgi:hypothetical protein